MSITRLGAAFGASALVAGSLALAAPAQAAQVTGQVTFTCTMPDFATAPPFDYVADVKVSGLRDTAGSSPVTVVMSTSDLPGVVPAFISMPSAAVEASFTGTANGSPITLATAGTTAVNPSKDGTKEPVKMPDNFQGTVATTDETVQLAFTKFDFKVDVVGGTCTYKSGTLPVLTPDLGTPPPTATPTPTPTKTPSPTATPTDEPTDEPVESEGVAAKGKVTFDCTLQTIGSPFTYTPTVTLEGARATADDSEVALRLKLTDIAKPDGTGLAPVAMDSDMKVTVTAKVGSETVDFAGTSRVNVGPSEPVAVPVMTATADLDGDKHAVSITAFKFDFGEIAGTTWYSDCKGSAKLSALTVGVGELEDEGDEDGSGTGGSNAGTGNAATLPRTGGADAMPVIALWALAFGVVGAALLVAVPRRREVN